MAIDLSFWKGKRVFLTGHTGFKGVWLSTWLQSLSATVMGFALAPPDEPNLFQLAGLPDEFSVVADIRALDTLRDAMHAARPQIVLHLAAQALVRESYADPVGTFETNVQGTVHVLEAARDCAGVKACVVVTSDKVYANDESGRAYSEDDALGGKDPYSASKACAELAVATFRQAYFEKLKIALATARAGNVIGGGDWSKDRLVPDILAAAFSKVPPVLRNPQAIRPWQHVLDPLGGYLALAQRLFERGEAYAQAWNFGPDAADSVSVEQMADQLLAALGANRTWNHDSTLAPAEAGVLRIDASKARHVLGWRPKLSQREAIEWTAQWYRAWKDGGDMRRYTQRQIAQYMERT